jgi:hypothetical protein
MLPAIADVAEQKRLNDARWDGQVPGRSALDSMVTTVPALGPAIRPDGPV